MTGKLSRTAFELSLKALVSISLIYWLLYSEIDVRQIQSHWRATQWGFLLVTAPIILSFNTIISVLRWKLVLGQQGLQISFWPLINIYLKGTVVSFFVPGGLMTGDVYRMYSLAKTTGAKGISVSSVMMDRILGLVSLLSCSLGSFYYLLLSTRMEALVWLGKPVFFATFIFFGMVVVAVYLLNSAGLARTQSNISVVAALQKYLCMVAKYFANKKTIGKVIVLSLGLQLGIIVWTYAISLAMHVNVPFSILCMTVPLINLFALVPVSFGGFGVRETAFMFFLVPFGVKPSEAVSISLVSAFLQNGLMLLAWFGLSLRYKDYTFRAAKLTFGNKS